MACNRGWRQWLMRFQVSGATVEWWTHFKGFVLMFTAIMKSILSSHVSVGSIFQDGHKCIFFSTETSDRITFHENSIYLQKRDGAECADSTSTGKQPHQNKEPPISGKSLTKKLRNTLPDVSAVWMKKLQKKCYKLLLSLLVSVAGFSKCFKKRLNTLKHIQNGLHVAILKLSLNVTIPSLF